MPSRIWISIVDSKNLEDLRDLDHLDAILWGANLNAKRGDLILIYRTAPYSDFSYVFRALSDARPTMPSDLADTAFVIQLGHKVRFQNPVTLKEIKTHHVLKNWSFSKYQQGSMQRKKDIKEEGFWKSLNDLIIKKNRFIKSQINKLEKGTFERHRNKTAVAKTPEGAVKLKVFISYASEDFKDVKKMYRKLLKESIIDPWLDKMQLLPGHNWRDNIKNSIEQAQAILICLSPTSFYKKGVVQEEIKWALKIADKQPEGTTFIIPVKLRECQVQDRLSRWHFAELYKKGGYSQLVSGLRQRAKFLKIIQ
jgi:hypothetical protein